jgi:hypothetical protein
VIFWDLLQHREITVSAPVAVNLGAVISCLVEIALLPGVEVAPFPWATTEGTTGEVIEDGWTRY